MPQFLTFAFFMTSILQTIFPLCISINVACLPHFDLDLEIKVRSCKWHLARQSNIESYRVSSNEFLSKIDIPTDLLHCTDVNCNVLKHRQDIDMLYTNMVRSLSEAADESIPHSVGKTYRTRLESIC